MQQVIEKFARVFEMTYEFKDMAYSLRLLIDQLGRFEDDRFGADEQTLYKALIESIVQDLRKWIHEVTIEQTARDIHYLDASLLANISQIDMMIQNKQN